MTENQHDNIDLEEDFTSDDENEGAENQSDESQKDESKKTEQDTTKDDSKKDDSKKDESKDDVKERNRKGYEIRKKSEDFVPRSEFDKVNKKLDQIIEREPERDFRATHQGMSDGTFNSLKAFCKGSGLSLEEGLKNELFSKAYEGEKAKSRIEDATAGPSTKTSSASGSDNYADMSLDDVGKRADEIKARA